ncbi:MAG: PDDEXK nuclease domain-containing protein [Propionibacteriaceae bacterium]|jgi:predicted nuclease of restriction endonuclease-like (RecB) superfamily|nr:PDDEXK nuclease domain-containing protein [Propionibacteriaceae bacterium]
MGTNEVELASAVEFDELIAIIERARMNAFRAVNREMVGMYWDIGEYLSNKARNGGWGTAVVKEFSRYVQQRHRGIRGFSPQNIWRMKQFYETYAGNEKLSPLVTEINWTSNVLILNGAKTDEAREFYLVLAAKYNYSKRELERQLDSALFERTMLSNIRNTEIIKRHPELAMLRDNYVLEFLDLPENYREVELRRLIKANLREFILEFGKDFSLMGDEYRLTVGGVDFSIDLLFYSRELTCMVAIELKVGPFKPEHLGQLNFYLEALDRDVRKPNENPSVGLIFCTDKNDSVVEYALSRSVSPAMIADYKLYLPDKRILESKLRELTEYAEFEVSEDNDVGGFR